MPNGNLFLVVDDDLEIMSIAYQTVRGAGADGTATQGRERVAVGVEMPLLDCQ